MSNPGRTKMGLWYIKRYTLLSVAAWSVIVFALLLWNAVQINKETHDYAHIYTNAAFEKDIIYRRWATMHGGVYVPVTNKTPPNPYLSDIPERDITTPSGRRLTLMNPAYMTRQVYEFERDVSGARSHLTSLKTIRPENAPDEWEKKALIAFEQGVAEISSIENIEEREYFRLIRPLITEKECLKCHAGQGYKVNDIRGGISVSLPMDSIRKLAGTSQSRNILIYLFLWLVGTGGIVFGYYWMSKSEFKRNQAEKELGIAYLDLEKKVHDRTADLSQVNEILRKEQQFLAAVFDSIEEGVVSCDVNGVITSFNRATRQFHGLPAEPIPADQWAQHYDLFLPDGKTLMKKEDVSLFRVLQGEQVRNAEMMIIPKQGHARTLVASGQTLKDHEGKIIGAVVAMHDITERKKAEEALQYHELLLRETGRIAKIGGWEFDPATGKGTWTEEVARIHDLDPDDVTSLERGMSFYKGEARVKIDKAIKEAVELGKTYELELELVTAKGTRKWVRTIGQPRVEKGKVVHVRGSFQDITERKQAEEEIRAINEELVAINRIITAVTGISSINDILEKVMDEALGITGLEGGTICMVSPQNTLQLASHRATSEATILDLTANEIKVGDCLCGECAQDHKPLILWDREAVLKFATREATRGEDIRFHAAFPLIIGGKCLGVLCVFTRTDKKPEERRLKLLETVTAQIALAVHNAGLFEETLRNAAILEDRVKERTAELEEKIAEIQRMNRLFVGRELQMIEMKERIRELEKKFG